MSRFWKNTTVRARLTIWNVGVMLLVLAVYAAGVFWFVSRSVSHALDDRLRGDFVWASEMWEQQPDGTLTWFEGPANGEDYPWLTVWSLQGRLLFNTAYARWQPIASSERLAAAAGDHIVEAPAGTDTFRVLSRRSNLAGRHVVIQVARSEAPMWTEISQLIFYLALGLPLALLVAGVGGYLMARHALGPAERMADRARSITADSLSDRLPVGNPNDEFGRLATVFNDTLERLEGVFGQMQRFTSEVSHELRTPLTAIRTVGEVGLREPRDGRAYREIIGSMLEEVDRLVCLVTRLLTWSRLESGHARSSVEEIDLLEFVNEIATHLGVLAEERDQRIEIAATGRPCVAADRVLLRQALTNLVDNAIKYTPEGGLIRIRAYSNEREANVEVSDTGAGIDTSSQSRLYERFYRAGAPDTEAGAGLGLSIAKRAIETTGGRLQHVRTDAGCTFRVTLPDLPAPRLQHAG